MMLRRREEDEYDHERSCPNSNYLFPGNVNYAHSVRHPLKDYVEKHCPRPRHDRYIVRCWLIKLI